MNDTEQKLFDLQCIEAHSNEVIIDQIERLLGELKGRYISTSMFDPEFKKLDKWMRATITEDILYNGER